MSHHATPRPLSGCASCGVWKALAEEQGRGTRRGTGGTLFIPKEAVQSGWFRPPLPLCFRGFRTAENEWPSWRRSEGQGWDLGRHGGAQQADLKPQTTLATPSGIPPRCSLSALNGNYNNAGTEAPRLLGDSVRVCVLADFYGAAHVRAWRETLPPSGKGPMSSSPREGPQW